MSQRSVRKLALSKSKMKIIGGLIEQGDLDGLWAHGDVVAAASEAVLEEWMQGAPSPGVANALKQIHACGALKEEEAASPVRTTVLQSESSENASDEAESASHSEIEEEGAVKRHSEEQSPEQTSKKPNQISEDLNEEPDSNTAAPAPKKLHTSAPEPLKIPTPSSESPINHPQIPESPANPQEDTPNAPSHYPEDPSITEESAFATLGALNDRTLKATRLFATTIKAALPTAIPARYVRIAAAVAQEIDRNAPADFPRITRSKLHNLKTNSALPQRLYSGALSPAAFVEMRPEEMLSEEQRSQDTQRLTDALLASHVATAAAETEIFTCSRCKEKKCTYTQMQTRSCDEPMTTFVHCTVCGHRWRC